MLDYRCVCTVARHSRRCSARYEWDNVVHDAGWQHPSDAECNRIDVLGCKWLRKEEERCGCVVFYEFLSGLCPVHCLHWSTARGGGLPGKLPEHFSHDRVRTTGGSTGYPRGVRAPLTASPCIVLQDWARTTGSTGPLIGWPATWRHTKAFFSHDRVRTTTGGSPAFGCLTCELCATLRSPSFLVT